MRTTLLQNSSPNNIALNTSVPPINTTLPVDNSTKEQEISILKIFDRYFGDARKEQHPRDPDLGAKCAAFAGFFVLGISLDMIRQLRDYENDAMPLFSAKTIGFIAMTIIGTSNAYRLAQNAAYHFNYKIKW